MTPAQRIKQEILQKALKENSGLMRDFEFDFGAPEITAENIDKIYEEILINNSAHYDYEDEFRESGEDTNISSDYSRHYESKYVARQLADGTWVGWTYWYGGGLGWIGPFKSGESIKINHTYDNKGNYTIRIKARDIYNLKSDWSTLKVKISRNLHKFNEILFSLLNRFPLIFSLIQN